MYALRRRPVTIAFLVVAIISSACVPVFRPVEGPVETIPASDQVEILVRILVQGDAEAKASAAYSLGQLGEDAAAYVPDLLDVTHDQDPTVRTVAAFALGKIGTPAGQIMPRLLEMSTSPDEPVEVRYSAIRALGNLGTLGTSAIAALSALLAGDPDENIRWAAVDALTRAGAASDPKTCAILLDALMDSSWYVSNRTREMLNTQGDDGVACLLEEFKKDPGWDRRNAILKALAGMPADAAPQLGKILSADANTFDLDKALSAAGLGQMGQIGLDEIDRAAQNGEIIAIAALPQFGEAAVPILKAMVEDSTTDPFVRDQAIESLCDVGAPALNELRAIFQTADDDQRRTMVDTCLVPIGAQAVPVLLDLLDDPSTGPAGQQAIIGGLGTMAVSPTSVIPKLLTIVQDKKATMDVRVAAVEALGRYRTVAENALPVLQTLLEAEGPNLKTAAISALGKIGPGRSEITASLLAVLKQCDDTAIHASQAFGEMGIIAQEAVSGLMDALGCPNPKVQAAAAQALGQIGPSSAQVVDALITKLASSNATVANAAVKALGQLGPGGLPALVATLATAEAAETRRRARDALASAGGIAAPILVQLLEDSSMTSETHTRASEALIEIGQPALPFLVQGLREGEVPARQRILETLYGIGPHAFEGFQWALQDSNLTVDWIKLEAIYDEYDADVDASVVISGFAVPEALPFLITSLPMTASIEQRRQAPRAIGFIGPEAAPAAPALALALHDSDPVFRCEAAQALLLTGPRIGVAAPALTAALTNTEEDTVCQVDPDVVQMIALSKPREYQLLLAELLHSGNQIPFQRLLIYVLAGMGPSAEIAVPSLVSALKTPTLRRLAAEALGQVGAAAHPALLELLRPEGQAEAVPSLTEALAGLNNDLRRSAAYALLQSTASFDSETTEALTVLAQDEGEDRFMRAVIASALAAHGHSVSGFWAGIGLADPAVQACPWWPTEGIGSVRLTGLDAYEGLCVYNQTDLAPTWDEIYNWLISVWQG